MCGGWRRGRWRRGGGGDGGGVLLLNRAGRDSSFPLLNVEQMEYDETLFSLRDSECEIGFRIKLRELKWPSLCRNWETGTEDWKMVDEGW